VTIPLTNGPGVYIQELPNPVHAITGVQTSVTAFYGPALRGVVDDPYQVNSWADYENQFGSLDSSYPLSYAVYLFFLNGGTTALVVRYNDPSVQTASAQLSADITLDASSPGEWGTHLVAVVDQTNLLKAGVNQFNLTIKQMQGTTVLAQEVYSGASLNKGTPQYLPTLLLPSQLVKPAAGNQWTQQLAVATIDFGFPAAGPAGAQPAAAPITSSPVPLGDQDQRTGIYALLKADIFNILCLPVDPETTYDPAVLDVAAVFCKQQRAMLMVDPPVQWGVIPLQFETITGQPALGTASENAAVYYPNLVIKDDNGAEFNAAPGGAVAGVWATTDASRGVWKAPAGDAATITGITGFTAQVDDGESGTLNPLAVNGLRTMPLIGPVVWGARTTVGADQLGDQWKYLPVRRLALYIEESLRRGTRWAVFEPNAEPLWSSLRLNVTTFMQELFRQGAFAGSTPTDAYLVVCDDSNNPPDLRALGIVNILVGFAPLYPAEFVIISIQQQPEPA
jgi:phage tail sheath protein FI